MKNRKIKKVAVVTGTRAEYGILKPLIEKINDDNDLELQLMVTGMHLLKKFGYSIKEIENDGFPIASKIRMYDEDSLGELSYHGVSLGRAVSEFTREFVYLNPDIVLVIGDRLEALAPVLSASTLNIPIGHIHAGDSTDSGHIDEQIRFAISRFSHLLFAPTEKCVERLTKMGEEPWRAYNVGALGLDSILSYKPLTKEELFKKLNLNGDNPVAIIIFHPVIHEYSTIDHQIESIMKAVIETKINTVVIYPNNDLGSKKIIEIIKKYSNFENIKLFENLEHNIYISLMYHANLMIGNSSSGIIEAPSLGLPVINVGSRNTGREHGDNVLFVKPVSKEIVEAINKALYDIDFIEKVKKKNNPWGDGKTSERLVNILKNTEINEHFMRKRILY
ncbi:UDP-N-acetylglucosamine 2-epimerase [Methanococcus aeolicus Nankai-3]|uniref:UDP-N-acetylglucosamine 2-epimerase n=1 Tax=Methanococcus aeolicus (strain ATCC BAA-1280 / DSM 17508 / OCM 812 / Nankai-3) TaxID=419665 RepID=A6UU37_META3|nr:UDP-N-acetylglucosamine 2-epimerase [Methanococcus aeolicus]ABR56009.1 UDP-N-acetylglucosamine 2-epimerase [Methanococcus aeolicus Nankai-3]